MGTWEGQNVPVTVRIELSLSNKPSPWRRKTRLLGFAEPSRARLFYSEFMRYILIYIHLENNLFLVKRLIQRTDMRNPDSTPRRYTSLAWAAVLCHEETFEFLLTTGHDDEEQSRVSCVAS